jgi:hypothetical protein
MERQGHRPDRILFATINLSISAIAKVGSPPPKYIGQN